MHITVVGAGVLGRVYGLRLAAAGLDVSFVVRAARVAETAPFVVEQVNGTKRRDTLDRPDRVTAIPPRTSSVLVTVRFDQMDDELIYHLRGARAVPLVILSPLLPKQTASLEASLGRRITAAMPSVSGYLDEHDVVRYWLVRVASTLIDEPPAGATQEATRAALDELARRLTEAGIGAHLERDVASLNVATTTAFFPLIAAIDAGSGIDGLLADKELLATVLDAAKESDALSRKLGKAAPWAHLLTKFVGPYTLKPAVTLAHKLFPEAVRFAETHFGPKLHGQHVAMGAAILELGREQAQAMPALERLMAVLKARENKAA